MNENYLHELIDEAITLQAQGGDLEAFYARHQEFREEVAALLSAAQPLAVLKNASAPSVLRGRSQNITARAQYILPSWHMWTSPQVLSRAAAFAVLVIVVGSGFAYRQNSLRNEALASFDAVANDRQAFLDTIGTSPSIAARTNDAEASSVQLFAATPAEPAPPESPALSAKMAPSPAETGETFEDAPALESTGIDAMYEEQSALEALQQESTTL